jgi:hypothetical protein
MTIELRLLPTVSWRGQEVTAPRLRGLLALLAVEHRRGCSTALLVDGLWPEARPENPAKALQVVVARARARLGADTVVSTPTGYRLGLGEEQVDATALLSRHRPDAGEVEVVRTAAALMTANAFLAAGPGPVRTLAVLRRLPPARPDTLVGAVATVLCALPGPLDALCESDEPLLACVAGFVASYVWEARNDLDRALAAARRMLDACGDTPVPLLRIMVPSRLGELCLRTERGEEALRHMTGALSAQEQLGDRHDLLGLGWGMVFGHLQTGDLDEAERRLERVLLARPEDAPDDVFAPDLAVRAEIALARGETEAGLALWRRAADRLAGPAPSDPWALEIQAATVVAHAAHGRLDLVPALLKQLADGGGTSLPACGARLLVLGMADVEGGRCGRGARLIALAEAFGWPRNFPTMGSARARAAARTADRAAIRRAVNARVSGARRRECSSPSNSARCAETNVAYSAGNPSNAASTSSACGSPPSAPPGTFDRSRTSRGSLSAALTSAYRVTSRAGVRSPGSWSPGTIRSSRCSARSRR